MASKSANLDPLDGRLVITIEEAGVLLGLSRNTAYAAAARGELPIVNYGRRKVVPVEALRRQLAAAGVVSDTPTAASNPVTKRSRR
jgi:excisionase family DNA binding protein